MEVKICLHFERGKEMGGGWRRRRREVGIPGRRGEKEKWEGAVAIRKSLQGNRDSSNHGTAIYNAYEVTSFFIERVFREDDRSLSKAQESGKHCMHAHVFFFSHWMGMY